VGRYRADDDHTYWSIVVLKGGGKGEECMYIRSKSEA